MGRAEHVVVALAVLEAEQVGAVLGPAVRRFVGIAREQSRQQDFLPANGIHLFANDTLYLAQHPQSQRQPRVDAWSDTTHVAGTNQQFVAGNFGVRGIVTQGTQEQVGQTGNHEV